MMGIIFCVLLVIALSSSAFAYGHFWRCSFCGKSVSSDECPADKGCDKNPYGSHDWQKMRWNIFAWKGGVIHENIACDSVNAYSDFWCCVCFRAFLALPFLRKGSQFRQLPPGWKMRQKPVGDSRMADDALKFALWKERLPSRNREGDFFCASENLMH